MLFIRVDWVHGYTTEDEQLCSEILRDREVGTVQTLLSYPPRLLISLIDEATPADAERLAERLAMVPHLDNVEFHEQQTQTPGPLPPAAHRVSPREFEPPR